MQNKTETFGPIALTATPTTNILAPAAAGAGAVGYTATAHCLHIRHIRVNNKTGVAHTYSLYKGATGANAAGTEVSPLNHSVPANGYQDLYFQPALRLEGANGFLVGGADALTSLVLTAEGEIASV